MSDTKIDSAPEFVSYWADELKTRAASITKLKGGINNYVYRCGDDCGNQYVIKGYLQAKSRERDQMQAEIDFLKYANIVASEYTPELIHVDHERRCVVLEHLAGSQYKEDVPPKTESIHAAANFYKKLNASHPMARKAVSMNAAEGFISLNEHISNVKARINRLNASLLSGEAEKEAAAIISCLRLEIDCIHERTIKQILRGEINDYISHAEQYVSPSDFGFHNAIETKSGVRFIDFEFSGWDDPTKTIIDFELQPKIPTGSASVLLNIIEKRLIPSIKTRYVTLKPILKLKWACILLSFLNESRFKELLEICPDVNVDKLFAARLKRIRNYMPERYLNTP